MRINARLDEDRSEKLSYMARATGASITEIIKRAIDAYFEQFGDSGGNAAEIFTASGFIGCGEGDSDLSERYKDKLKRSLATKHAHR